MLVLIQVEGCICSLEDHYLKKLDEYPLVRIVVHLKCQTTHTKLCCWCLFLRTVTCFHVMIINVFRHVQIGIGVPIQGHTSHTNLCCQCLKKIACFHVTTLQSLVG